MAMKPSAPDSNALREWRAIIPVLAAWIAAACFVGLAVYPAESQGVCTSMASATALRP